MKEYRCGFITVEALENSCLFCTHCTDVFYDSKGIYMLFCDVSTSDDMSEDIKNGIAGNCIKYKADDNA